jgi:hypothetical protein
MTSASFIDFARVLISGMGYFRAPRNPGRIAGAVSVDNVEIARSPLSFGLGECEVKRNEREESGCLK